MNLEMMQKQMEAMQFQMEQLQRAKEAAEAHARIAEAARIEAEAKAKATKRAPSLSVKLSPKGTGVVCVYGLGKKPVSLYPNQWEKLLAIAPQILEFVKANPGISKEEKLAQLKAV